MADKMTDELFDLTDKVALITGSAQGLGRAFAEAMAEAGADVVCVDIQNERNEETATLVSNLGRQALVVQADITKEEDAHHMVAEAIERFGRIDILVNNAAAMGMPVPVHELPLDDWNNVLAVDLTGVFLCCKEVVKGMMKQECGKIINIASVVGLVGTSRPSPPGPAYAAAKGAVVNFTRELALEYAPFGINVNCIAPAVYETDMVTNVLNKMPGLREAIEETLPLSRGIGKPNDLKGAVVFLASRASDYMTGHTLVVDQGFLAK
jgi:gluconate 5-dehydrogenase